jgi:hypothetical protein
MQVDAQRQPQAIKRQTEQEPSQKGHQPQLGGQRSSSGLSAFTHSSTQATKVPSQPQQVKRASQMGRSIQHSSSERSMARGSSAASLGVPHNSSPQAQNMVQDKSAGKPTAHRVADTQGSSPE